jgi:RNA recognition motif-containing protein
MYGEKDVLPMGRKIYVGNLNYSTSERELEDLFSQYGSVASTNIIVDRMTDRSKGFGFVEMEDEQAAEAAISALNNYEFGGRNLKVDEAKERKPRF